MKVSQREAALAALLDQSGLLPPGTRAKVEILAGPKRRQARKKRADATAFDPNDSVFVTLEPGGDEPNPDLKPLTELVQALHQAEQTPGHAFVALLWFRDTFLPQAGYPWAQTTAERQRWLREAILRRWITTDRLANPRHPAFPTTAIRINRAAAEVERILGQGEDAGFGWEPVALPGEPMSATVLNGRK